MRTVRFRFKDAMNKSFTISLDEPKDNLTLVIFQLLRAM